MKYHHRGSITPYLDVATDAGDRAQGRLGISRLLIKAVGPATLP